jgi:hypothetical protein
MMTPPESIQLEHPVLHDNDVPIQLSLPGPITLMAISAVALHILQFPPLRIICWTCIGYCVGSLAQKSISQYNFAQSLTRSALILNARIPSARVAAFVVSLIVSFVFPILASMFAFAAGAFAGFLVRENRQMISRYST